MAMQEKPPAPASKPKAKTNPSGPAKQPKTKPTNTLDRWFKPATSATSSKKSVSVTAAVKSSSEDSDKTDDVQPQPKPKKLKEKSVGASKTFVQRYIHITDECRVCEQAKTDEASRCELRCATCAVTVHKKCYGVKELPDGDWHCRRCQFVLDETSWEDVSSLVDGKVRTAEDVAFPKRQPLDETEKLHELHTNCDFAAVFLFLQRFRRMGLKIANTVTLESLANALLSPKEPLCEELHTRLLSNVNATMSKKHTWNVNLLRFLRDAEYPPAIAEDTTFPSAKDEEEKLDAFYFGVSVKERVSMLKFLCEIQFDRNDSLVELIDDEDAESMRNESVGTDAADRSYFILEDAATVPDGDVWVCRCAKVGGTNWETVCNDLESVQSLVEELSLSVAMADLQLWKALSSGVLKKLTRQLEKRKRQARWQQEMSSRLTDAALYDGIGRRSLRSRRQVNYADIDAQEDEFEEEEQEEEEEDGGEEEEAFEAKSSDDEVVSETDGEEDDDEDQSRRTTRGNRARAKKRMAPEGISSRTSKRSRHSQHEVTSGRRGLRRSTRNATHSTSSSQDDGNSGSEDDEDDSDEN